MSQIIELKADTFNFFCKRTFTYPILNKKILNGLSYNQIDEFQTMCYSILEGNMNINIAKLRLCLMNLLLNDPNQINNCLITIYQNITKKIYNEINDAVLNNEMTIKLFIDKYQLLYY